MTSSSEQRHTWSQRVTMLVSGLVVVGAACNPTSGGRVTGTPSSAPTAKPVPSTTAPTMGLADVYERVESGVVKILTVTCDGDYYGTGFLISPRLVVTAAHVVADATTFAVETPKGPVGGRVLGSDDSLDIALVQLQRPMAGHRFRLDRADPRIGATVAAIGFPVDQPKTLTTGTVSGVDRAVPTADAPIWEHQVQTDTALNPGNSGGPLIDAAGRVVGIVSNGRTDAQGISFAASAALAAPLLSTWRSAHETHAAPPCANPIGPGTDQVVASVEDGAFAGLASATFDEYFGAVNSGDFGRAQQRQAPHLRLPLEAWAEAVRSSYNFDVVMQSAYGNEFGGTAWVTFTSIQDGDKGPRPGETCTSWSLDYYLIPADDGLLWIDRASAHSGAASMPC